MLKSLLGIKENSLDAIDFVIVASQRTGSNMLVSLLDAYPGVRCHGELFRKGGRPKEGALQILNDLPVEFEDPVYREDYYLEYLRLVRGLTPDKCLFGFKLMLNQAREARNALVRKRGCKIILLYRENLLAVYSSNQIAKVTGQGNVTKDQQVKSREIEFDEAGFEAYSRKQREKYDTVRQELNRFAGKRYMELSYVELCSPQGKEKVEDFLRVARPDVPLAPRTTKRNSNRIVDRFSNPEVVVEYLERTGNTSWMEEMLE